MYVKQEKSNLDDTIWYRSYWDNCTTTACVKRISLCHAVSKAPQNQLCVFDLILKDWAAFINLKSPQMMIISHSVISSSLIQKTATTAVWFCMRQNKTFNSDEHNCQSRKECDHLMAIVGFPHLFPQPSYLNPTKPFWHVYSVTAELQKIWGNESLI